VLHVLERDFGITMPRWLTIEFAKVVQTEAERTGGEVDARRVRQLFDAAYVAVPDDARVVGYDLARDGERVCAEVTLADGQRLSGNGGGAVEALIDAWERVRQLPFTVEAFDEMALGAGTGASAMACVRVRAGSDVRVGVAFAPDTTAATLQAVSTAIARFESPEKTALIAEAGRAGVSLSLG